MWSYQLQAVSGIQEIPLASCFHPLGLFLAICNIYWTIKAFPEFFQIWLHLRVEHILLCLSCLKKGDRFPWPSFIAQGVTRRETEFQMYSTADDLAELYPEISLLARIGRDITFTPPIGESSAAKFGMHNDVPDSCHCFGTSTCHLKNWSFNPKSTPRSFSQVESGLYQSRDMPGPISWQSVGK